MRVARFGTQALRLEPGAGRDEAAAPAAPSAPPLPAVEAPSSVPWAPVVARPADGLALRVGDGLHVLTAQPDGGLLVDPETETTLFTGPAARRALEDRPVSAHQREIILPEGAALDIQIGARRLGVSEPGAVLVPAGVEAKVRVLEGEPVVIESARAPGWYTPSKPGSAHQRHFEQLVQLNGRLLGRQQSHPVRQFPAGTLSPLLDARLLERHRSDRPTKRLRMVRWAQGARVEGIVSALTAAGAPADAIDGAVALFGRAQARRFHESHGGAIPRERLPQPVLRKLLDAGLVDDSGRELVWTHLLTDKQLRRALKPVKLRPEIKQDVVDLWRATTRSGYDTTGLSAELEDVAYYRLSDRTNPWDEQPTEWLVSSDTYVPKDNPPFTVGVSSVRAPAPLDRAVDFHALRPAECLHRHPERDGERQTEGYLLTKGKAALLTVRDGQPSLVLLHPGDLAIIEPGVLHQVVAAAGDYEHLAFQVPSAFQYGFKFKEELRPEDAGVNSGEVVAAAVDALDRGASGVVALPRR